MVNILSLGCGVNSVALLVWAAQGKIQVDEAVFADPGSEEPETYEYWQNVIVPFCFDNEINLARLNREGNLLKEECIEKKIIPIRAWRWCTDKWKIKVVRNYAFQKYGKEKEVNFIIGFSSDEKERGEKCVLGNKYPLIEKGIDREGCKKIIQEVEFTHNKPKGLPIPVKSGCSFCVFKSREAWLSLLKNHPEKYAEAEQLEKNCSRYPEMFLAYPEIGTLESLRKQYEANKKISAPEKKTTQRMLTCPLCEVTYDADKVDYSGYENFHLQVKKVF